MKTYLRLGSEYLVDARCYPSKRAAIEAYRKIAINLYPVGQEIDGSLHYASSKAELNEYPNFVLSLGKHGGVKVARA